MARIFCRKLMNIHAAQIQHCFKATTRLSASTAAGNIEEIKPIQWNLKSFYNEHPGSEALLTACKQFALDETTLITAIREKPEIAHFHPVTVSSNINEFLQLGFEATDVSAMVSKYPYVLNYEPLQIINTFETWRSCGVHERFLRSLFIQEPWLFSVSDKQVKFRVNRLHYLMSHKINRITAILSLNPTLLIHDWDKVEINFEYIMKKMRILEKEISRSRALILPLSHIKMRHCFVDKCGIYVRPGLKDDAGFNPHKNPPLTDIIDTPDDSFAINVAKVSPEEYQVYKKLYTYEDGDVGMNTGNEFN